MKTPLLITVLLFANLCVAQKTQKVQYSTYIGGNGSDFTTNIQLTKDDDIIISLSGSTGCVTTPGVHQTLYSGGQNDALLQKRDKNGTLLWSSYFGGGLEEYANKATILKSGKIALAGQTSSLSNIAFNGHQENYGGGTYDGFLAIFNEDGTLDWSTYFGGTGEDAVYGVNEDSEENLYISGYTSSSSNISTVGSYQLLYGGNEDGFLSKFSSDGQLIWSTYIGGSGIDGIVSMDIDASGDLWLGGLSYSTSGLVTNNAFDPIYSGRGDALLMSFDKDGKKVYGTYYGGTDTDAIYVLHIDKAGNIWFGGPAKSATDIASPGAISEFNSGNIDVFLVKFNKNKALEWATYLGGNKWDTFFGMDVDSNGNAILNMMTQSDNFHPIENAMQKTYGGGPWDAVYTKIDSSGNLIWSTFHGGTGNDRGIDVKVNSEGNLIFTTTVGSQNLHTDDADDKMLNGLQDALLAIIKEEEISTLNPVVDILPEINVYPNPVSKTMAISVENPDQYIFEIYDVIGNKMNVNMNKNDHIETDLFLPGLYYVKATNPLKNFTLYKNFIKI
ncbi:MAG: T9SS type A sorting domain-containing protein [Saprospiraceae bacterium]